MRKRQEEHTGDEGMLKRRAEKTVLRPALVKAFINDFIGRCTGDEGMNNCEWNANGTRMERGRNMEK